MTPNSASNGSASNVSASNGSTNNVSEDVDAKHGTSASTDGLAAEVAARLARRPWPATPIRNSIDLSFEFFPANTDKGRVSLARCASKLAELSPKFFSVTYGAGGSTRDRTHASIAAVREGTDVPIAGHITCVASSQSVVHSTLDQYRQAGISRIVALRGDAPEGYDPAMDTDCDGYSDAASLVAGIRERPDGESFDVSVAAYPEIHPKASSATADLDNLKRKVDAGADQAITQFFFDTDAFLRFYEAARAADITVPIVPGIMPVTNFTRIANFAERCGTKIPDWMPQLFEGLDESPDAQEHIASTLAAEQCRRLAEHGIRQFHFYTMNKSALSLSVCQMIGIEPPATDARKQAREAS